MTLQYGKFYIAANDQTLFWNSCFAVLGTSMKFVAIYQTTSNAYKFVCQKTLQFSAILL